MEQKHEKYQNGEEQFMEEYCAVCMAELKKGPQLIFAVDDEDDMELEATELCPICHQNYIMSGEKMCKKCAEEMDYKEGREDPDDESWKEYLDDEVEDDEEDSEEMLSLARLAEEEGEELFDDEEEEEYSSSPEPDDFEIPEIDEADFEDTDEEDDEEEEDEDDEY